jgi:alpha-mannosidase
MRSFVDVNDGTSGLAIITRGLQEYEVFDRQDRAIAVSLLRTFPIILEVSEQKKQVLPDDGPQCIGKQVIEYAVFPHEGDTYKGGVIGQAAEYTIPLRAVQFAVSGEGTLPWKQGIISRQPEHVVISCIKKAQNAEVETDMVVVRLFNPCDKEVKETLEFGPEIKEARTLTMEEKVVGELKVKNKSITLTIPPKKIITLGIFR